MDIEDAIAMVTAEHQMPIFFSGGADAAAAATTNSSEAPEWCSWRFGSQPRIYLAASHHGDFV